MTKNKAWGWGNKIAAILFLSVLAFTTQGQGVLRNFNSTADATIGFETVTNTSTASVSSGIVRGGGAATTIVVRVVKTSGLVAGTITLLGSVDNVNYKAVNVNEGATALATFTATDATNTYHWRLNGSPFLYYRVTHTGAGTMVSTLDADLLKH